MHLQIHGVDLGGRSHLVLSFVFAMIAFDVCRYLASPGIEPLKIVTAKRNLQKLTQRSGANGPLCSYFLGKLTMIVGPVGSGKSSLLSAMLGEMTDVSGSVNWNKYVFTKII